METDEPSTSQESNSTTGSQQEQPQQQQQQQEEESSTDPPATALADLLEEVLRVNGRMEDHIRQYRDIMRNPAVSWIDLFSFNCGLTTDEVVISKSSRTDSHAHATSLFRV